VDEAVLQSYPDALVDAELIYQRGIAPEASYQFKHALIQDAAYQALLKTTRKQLHRRVAEAITTDLVGLVDERPELVARHWTDVRELELMDRFTRVLQLTAGGSTVKAAAAVRRGQELAEKTGNLRLLIFQMVGSYATVVVRGDLPAASGIVEQMLDLAAREGSSDVLSAALGCGVMASYVNGQLNLAENRFAAAMESFQRAPIPLSAIIGTGFGFGSHAAGARIS
jgi:hypothetical protein